MHGRDWRSEARRPALPGWRGALGALLALWWAAACTPTPAEPARPPAATTAPVAAAPTAAAVAQPTMPPRATVRVGYAPLYSLAPTFIAKEKGYFDAQNLDVQLELINSGPEGFAGTAAGHLEVTTTSVAAAVLNAWATDVNIRMFAAEQAYLPNAPAGSALVVRRDLKDGGQVNTIADLRGRSMAISALGTAQEWSLDEALRTGGLRAADVDIVTMPFPDTLPALGNGAVDGALALEPLATEAIERGYAISLTTDFALGAQITELIANGTWLREQRDAATRYLVAYLQAARDLYGDGWRRDDNVAIIEKWTRLPAATIKRVLPIYCDPNGVINVASLEAQQAFYAERGYLRYSAPLDLRSFLDDGPRADAVRRLGEFTPR